MNIKEVDNVLLNPDFAIEFLQLLAKFGIVSELDVRNVIIRKEYFLAKEKGEKVECFMDRISEQFHCTPKNINQILYGKPRKKYKQIKVKYSVKQIKEESEELIQENTNL